MSKISTRKVGTGGYWRVLNERKDSSVVKQETSLSCVAAVGEMLLRERGIEMTQTEIIDIIGESSTTDKLANLLNEKDEITSGEKWHGVIVAIKNLRKIANKSSFGAVLREGTPIGHLVLVEKLEENLLFIKDPWDGTSYQMRIADFLEVWNGEIIFKWNLSE